ncbi:SpoIIE family protein phosphatase [Saccharothrix sp. ST-888]|uniref:SpoIIE family protein phosphatase n=1 Tax=Saccharothrix sp. ST-888 TaxID=1427391 RepID=UPI0005ED2D58|nr:SpoIIE family protein phosphatase [Saccharothrix sp. ST-888]
MFLWQFAVVVLLVAATAAALVVQAQTSTRLDAGDRSLAAAQALANSPGMVQALRAPDPTALLQAPAEKIRTEAGLDFVSVLSPEGIRYTDPQPGLIGKRADGDIARAAAGEAFTEDYRGSLGEAVRAIVPVTDPTGKLAGMVTTGITTGDVAGTVDRRLPLLLGSAAPALLLATAGAALMSRRLRRQTHGLGPAGITRMFEHHDAVLHAVREGVLITDGGGVLLLANDEARRLLTLPPDAEHRRVDALGLDPAVAELLTSGRSAADEIHPVGDQLLAVNRRPTSAFGGPPSWVATLRDTTELRAVAGVAQVARERLRLLYEAGTRIGTTLDVERTARELAEVAVPRFADITTVDLLEPVLNGAEPGPDPLTPMRRTASLGIEGNRPLYRVGERIEWDPSAAQALSLASGRAALVADLSTGDSWRVQDPERAAGILALGAHSLITVPMRARGVTLGIANFWRGRISKPFTDEDLSFAEELVAGAAVCIDNARRYTLEHAVAVTLQRSLLPRRLPEQNALEAAYRYLPAQAGVGGDWFDIIPLPGARVALVVGDVVGHGLHAAATMGRLRTAVHNFSSLDLAPDELLGHLDELVTTIDRDDTVGNNGGTITGATCLYAIYDPVTGSCTVASAGHPPPVIVAPDGTTRFPEVPENPPLGLATMPYEAIELELPQDTRIVFYTNGLVHDRFRDIDAGTQFLLAVLERPDRTPEQTCDDVLDALLPPHPTDDIALLVARTRLLPPQQVAQWEVPSDPAAVSRIRSECSRQLADWGLEDIAFITELILSELITNAIRYGTQPITVRLLCDRCLTCEVSDASSTSPHLRYASSTDEGGRGLFLVAQFADRWGTRYAARGKVIWTEQSLLPDAASGPGPWD